MARDVKGRKKGFYRYSSSKRTTKENMGPLLNEMKDRAVRGTGRTR